VKIHTIAYGTATGTIVVGGQTIPVPADPAAMAQIAALSGGQTFTAEPGGQLKSVYDQIGRAVGYDVHRREVTAWFTDLGLVLAMAGANRRPDLDPAGRVTVYRQRVQPDGGGLTITQRTPGALAIRESSVASGMFIISARATYDPSWIDRFSLNSQALRASTS